MSKGRIPWFLWPLAALVHILALVIGVIGRVVAAALGLVFMVTGAVIAFYLVPIWWVGIALVAVGFLLLIRSML